MDAGHLGFGFLAGLLSTLSPCVLPLLPLVLGGALAAHRFGLAALAAGLVLSFTTIGLFVATVGLSVGLDGDWVRTVSAVLLAGFGVVLLSGALQARFARATAGVSSASHRLLARLSPAGLGGQFVVGLVLGAAWSPCVGPTLGAASLLAAQGKNLAEVGSVMAAFALGAALPLVVVGHLSRAVWMRWRGRVAGAGQAGRTILAVGALALAALILTGLDHTVEAALVDASPVWLTRLTTRF